MQWLAYSVVQPSSLENIFISPKRNPISSHAPFLLLQPLASTYPLSVSMDLPILDIPYKWNHVLYNLLCFVSLTQHNVLKIHPSCRMTTDDVLTSFFMNEKYSFVGIYHILFIHSSTDGCLGCLYFGAVSNNTAMSIRVQFFVWTCFYFSWVYA